MQEQREIKKAKMPQKFTRQDSVLSFQGNEPDLTYRLNKYFAHFLDQNPNLINNFNSMFPLDYYDSSIFDEFLSFKNVPLPAEAACLIYSSGGNFIYLIYEV